MYAIIADGGRQLKVEEGQELVVDYRASSSEGDEIRFDEVLALRSDGGLKIGRPTVEGASVTAEVLGVVPGPKLVVQKFRRRKSMRRRTGHRQWYTRVRVQKISV